MPSHAVPPRDPRSIVTPDAFEVSSELLGLPLASPGPRLVALLIDLAVIGAITLVTKSFALVLGILVAFLFIREGFKRTPVKGSVFGRAMRLSVGCLGLWVGIITIVIWMAVGIGGGLGDRDEGPVNVDGTISRTGLVGGLTALADLAQGVELSRRLQGAATAEEAQGAANELAQVSRSGGLEVEQIRDILVEVIPDDVDWSDDTEVIVDRAIAFALGDSTLATQQPVEGEADLAASDQALGDPVVQDSLETLHRRVVNLQASADERQASIEELRAALREEREGDSIFSWLRDFVDELGFGFGWASLYLTVMLSWWKGQTVGKKAMKIRVVRLDGEPITWWTAFERAGGYAAGFATGLLGFAQIFWDANRQAIHDRIVGTVVIQDGAKKVSGWEEAL